MARLAAHDADALRPREHAPQLLRIHRVQPLHAQHGGQQQQQAGGGGAGGACWEVLVQEPALACSEGGVVRYLCLSNKCLRKCVSNQQNCLLDATRDTTALT